MAQHGGYRQPSKPAPVSGPGAMSKRTDGGQPARYVPGQAYGDGQALLNVQQSAPMAQAPSGPPAADVANLLTQTTNPIPAPTAYPNEPFTTGAPVGAGPGPEVLASGGATGPTRQKLMASLPPLMRMAEQPDASPELRALVRYLRSQL